MGLWKRKIEAAYAPTAVAPPATRLSISSPWTPQDSLASFTADALAGLLGKGGTLTRETALRIPGVKRAHGIICTQLAEVPLFQMNGQTRTGEQPAWLTTSKSGVAPYHRMFGVGSDLFFDGWACLGFTADMTDCLHVPRSMWTVDPTTGAVTITDGRVPAAFRARPVVIPLGFGENGLLIDGADTIQQARNIEAAYQARLENPIPLTVLTLDADRWDGSEPDERAALIEEWEENRRKHAVAAKPSWIGIDMPGQVQTDLYESGRNGVRIDIANHVGLPASILDGVRQGGDRNSGTEMRYTGVANGGVRGELWDFGMAKRMLLAVEARLSLDDVCEPGLSIRGDREHAVTIPEPTMNPTSED